MQIHPRELVEQSRNVHQVKEKFNTKQKEFWYLLSSDGHWDNPDCNQQMMERHLKQCQERDAMWFHFGDFFCAMQGKYDKRSDKSKLREEHKTGAYLDSLVNTAANWLMPYRDVIGVIGQGNHETSIQTRHETNLIERLVALLNANNDPHRVAMGGYGGWIRFMYEHATCNERKSLNLKYFHGHGGGGPVTKGVIQSQRQALIFPDADIVASGHVHEEYLISYGREKLMDSGRIALHHQWHVRLPTYKDEYKDGNGGWHIETGKPPKPVGAWWLKVEVVSKHAITFDFLKAK